MTIVYFIQTNPNFSLDNDIILLSVGFMSLFFSYVLVDYLDNLYLNKAIIEDGVTAKFSVYTHLFIIKLAIYEGIGLMNSTFYLITGNKIFLIFAAIALLFILLLKPNPDKMIDDLVLTYHERSFVQNPEKPFE